ncbi:MAG TPA: bifunctional hydroxymethylpyrimidine kinase/phosphomethylpyrimidine kinase, partial [Candidatus Polarisedimenticolaceae bacterium]|nr:bifunctional hydroxymethylpyrimidine kinase/phosphomethylpyrimidine kinase [Candidatus Polarisedimenticolaceae bacterium]
MRPVVLSVAGSDCSGGAGIQADLKAIEAGGARAMTVVTAVTAQNAHGVERVFVLDGELVRAQLAAVAAEAAPAAVKSGMLGDAPVVRELAQFLRARPPLDYVCDPVLASSGGVELLSAAGIDALREELFELTTLLTPNAPEA